MRRLWLISLILLLGAGGQQVITGKHRTAPPAAPSSPSVVQANGSNNSYGTSGSVSTLSNTTTGNNLWLLVNANGASSLTISLPTGCGTWTQVGTTQTLGYQSHQAVFTAPVISGGACTVGIIGTNTVVWALHVYEVANGSGGIDGSPVFNQNTAYCTTGCTGVSITTSGANELILYSAICSAAGQTYSSLSPYTLINQESNGDGAGFWSDYQLASAGTINATFDQTTGQPFIEIEVAIK